MIQKETVLENVKAFNKTKKIGEKLNTGHFLIQGPVKPVFISELLTTRAQRLFYLARSFQKQHNYAFCWSSHGIIYLRKDEKSPHMKIASETDIENLRKNSFLERS